MNAEQTTCCIVGGGPGGAVLALLLARKGIPVTLLEAHHDFDRDFRGDTVHPSVLDVLDRLGLMERLLQLPHSKLDRINLPGMGEPATFDVLGVKYPFVMLVPQARFLEFITAEAARYPHFRLVMGAHVQQLVIDEGVVRGVRYRDGETWHEVRAALTVGADGRFSKVRSLAGIKPVKMSSPIDALWFRLPRFAGDPPGLRGGGDKGHIVVRLDRTDFWQVACIIPKGSYQRLREEGLGPLRAAVAAADPLLADRVEELQDWRQVAVLSVEISRAPRWYQPGLLLIGDAAHVMSPVGGVGINYAIMDAVATANLLAEPLGAGSVTVRDLAAVQRRREWPARIIQLFQAIAQKRVLDPGLRSDRPLQVPFFLRFGLFRRLLLRLVAIGIRPEQVRD